MNILEINTVDFRGGAAQVMYNLKSALKKKGNKVSIFSASKTSKDDDVFLINKQIIGGQLSKLSKKLIKKDLPSYAMFKSRDIFRSAIANDIEFFKCDYILKTEEFKGADFVHCHNLHGNYFNLGLLTEISKIKPTIWTLHDMWPFTGHCSYSYECDKWQNGCGYCPDLSIYPPLLWDNTSKLLEKKRKIYNNSKLNIVVPSLWLKKKVEKSILGDKNIKLIYNGVDLSELKQGDKKASREELNLPLNKKIIMFLAAGGNKDKRKGWKYVEKVVNKYKDVLFLCIGGRDKQGKDKINNLKYINYIDSKTLLAKHFSASDIFLFTSLAENFSLVILEAMACGTPIVSFDVGGVKEAVIHEKNGYIAKYKDADDLINGVEYVLKLNEAKISAMSEESINRVKTNFSLEIMANNYINYYQQILGNK